MKDQNNDTIFYLLADYYQRGKSFEESVDKLSKAGFPTDDKAIKNYSALWNVVEMVNK